MDFNPLLDEDLTTLQDALAFLDNFDHTPAAFASLQLFAIIPVAMIELPASTPSTTKTLRGNVDSQSGGDTSARTSRRNRCKKKAELERLRHDVKVLEARLARLKKTDRSLSVTSSNGYCEDESVDEHLTHMSGLAATWKVVAVRQYQRRKQSEIMNRDLKRALAHQQKIVKSMEGLFARHTPQHVHDFELVHDAPAMATHFVKPQESDLAALLLAQEQQCKFPL